MDLLQEYNSDDELKTRIKRKKLTSLAPILNAEITKENYYYDRNNSTIYDNPTYSQMYSPLQGPEHPNIKSLSKNAYNTLSGNVEKHHIDNFTFDEQYHTFYNYGYANDPSSNETNNEYIGNKEKVKKNKGETIFRKINRSSKKKEIKREPKGDSENIDGYKGPWARFIENEETLKEIARQQKELREAHEKKLKLQKEKEKERENSKPKNIYGDQINIIDNTLDNKKNIPLPPCAYEETQFEYTQEYDYQGRTYMHCPKEERNLDPNHRCFIPKKWEHTWNGHTKGVNAIRFFPNTGHLLLSGSLDTTLKIWDVNSHRCCLRTMSGHSEGIRDITFNNVGDRIMSVSLDKWIKIWDTETGKVITRFSSGFVPLSAKYNPGNENEFLVAQKNKVIVGWDIRQSKIVQRYEEHMKAVNTVTFIDENRKFVSTSDDKKIYIWEYGIPVVLKHISEPYMHSVPFVKKSPDDKWLLCQSMDNQIIVYSATGKYRSNNKKKFKGHVSSGVACQVDMSPNCQFVMSGDYEGRLYFWDWKTSKIYQKIKAHKKVSIGAIWHPVHPSKVASCSWDGTIKFWD